MTFKTNVFRQLSQWETTLNPIIEIIKVVLKNILRILILAYTIRLSVADIIVFQLKF